MIFYSLTEVVGQHFIFAAPEHSPDLGIVLQFATFVQIPSVPFILQVCAILFLGQHFILDGPLHSPDVGETVHLIDSVQIPGVPFILQFCVSCGCSCGCSSS
jgi:hypothetical protein